MTLGTVKSSGIGQSAAKLLRGRRSGAHGERSETKWEWAVTGIRYSPTRPRGRPEKKGLAGPELGEARAQTPEESSARAGSIQTLVAGSLRNFSPDSCNLYSFIR